MFDNAKLFNGPDSWVTKHEVHMHMHAYVYGSPRPLLEKRANP